MPAWRYRSSTGAEDARRYWGGRRHHMVRVERACAVYVRFVSAILALAQARSVFDVATGFEINAHLGLTHRSASPQPAALSPWSPPCHALSTTSPPVPHAATLVVRTSPVPQCIPSRAGHLPEGFCISYSASAPTTAPYPGRYLLPTGATPTTSAPPLATRCTTARPRLPAPSRQTTRRRRLSSPTSESHPNLSKPI